MADMNERRTFYLRREIRARDLRPGDLAIIEGEWREVLDVLTDSTPDAVTAEHIQWKDANAQFIKDRLTEARHHLFVVVRYVRETPGSSIVDSAYAAFRYKELVTIQVPGLRSKGRIRGWVR